MQQSPADIAVSGGNVYWGTYFSVWKCGIDGCGGNPTVVASGQRVPDSVVVDQTNVYWANAGSPGQGVAKCAVGGCSNPTTLASYSGDNEPWGIAVDKTYVYWPDLLAGTVQACFIGGCGNPTILASGQKLVNMVAVDSTSVYWTAYATPGAVLKCSVTDCNNKPTTMASGLGAPNGLVIDATNVYWVNSGSGTIMTCPLQGCGNGPTVIASGQTDPWGITVDSNNVYWTNFAEATSGGAVMSCPIVGCNSPSTIASSQGRPSVYRSGPNKRLLDEPQRRNGAEGGEVVAACADTVWHV
jgi:hypothetical protein